jgi:ribosome-associated heat shock protein Hsp15
MIEKIRVDKWLWAVRFFKTRTAATKACEAGRVKKGDEKLKASSKITIGETLVCRVNHIQRTLVVKSLIEKRVGAPLALECYEDLTPPEDLIVPKLKSAFLLPNAHREKGTGRPTKKDRRDIDSYGDSNDNLED